MSTAQLPPRPSLEYLKKVAKARLELLRHSDPSAKLATALLAVAREYGFSSWRALKAHVEERRNARVQDLVEACRRGDVAGVQSLLTAEVDLARSFDAHGTTGLHAAAMRGHLAAVELLLRHGANPNARDSGDNATPLHFAAGAGHVDVVRALLLAGADVHGYGDLHESEVIGWATVLVPSHELRRDVVAVLLEQGARHHIYSAIAMGDAPLIRRLAEDNPETLDRRMSRFEQGQTPLHFAITRQRHDLLDLLIELGADIEARDASNRTALEAAMVRGDQEAMRRLHEAGAQPPPVSGAADFTAHMSALSKSVAKAVAMIQVPDVARALEWYVSIGFRELSRYDDNGLVTFAMVAFGNAELMLTMHGKPAPHDAGLWFYTDDVDGLHRELKSRRLEAAQAELSGRLDAEPRIEFEQDIEDMFYGARQFCIRDLNAYELYFIGTRS